MVSSFAKALVNRLQRRPSSGRYNPEIDGLRFWAIAIVVFGHLAERVERLSDGAMEKIGAGKSWDADIVNLIAHPQGGVFLFFAISGYIITTQFAQHKGSVITPDALKQYFARRALRIEPPYMFLLVATFLLITFTGFKPPASPRFDAEPHSLNVSLMASLLYAHGWFFGTFPRLFPPGWSLEIEIQYYISAPFVFWGYMKLPDNLRRITGLAILAGSGVAATFAPFIQSPIHAQLSLLGFFPYFWLGAMVALNRPWLEKLADFDGAPWLLSIGAALSVIALVVLDAVNKEGLIESTAGIYCQLAVVLVMFLAVFNPKSAFCKVSSLPVVSTLGGACYSLYLIHLQVIQVLSILVFKHMSSIPIGAQFAIALLIEVPIVVMIGMTYYAIIERFFMRRDWPSAVSGALKLGFARR